VLQERLLTTRVLHFTGQQLYWECGSQEASEAYPKRIPKASAFSIKNWSPKNFTITRDPRPDWEIGKLKVYRIWTIILRQYTRGDLTKPRDKLAAIAGIAKQMQTYFQGDDEYVAGLWKRHLIHQLLWQVDLKWQKSRPRYRAPSWSWAAVDGEIWNPYSDTHLQLERTELVKILEVEITPEADDNFLEIKEGHIRLSGILVKGYCREFKEVARPMSRLGISKDLIHEAVALLDTWPAGLHDSALYCIPLLQWEHTTNGQKYTRGLLLAHQGLYRRCGVFHITSTEGSDTFMRYGRLSQLDREEYEELVPDGTVTIRIV